MENLGNLNRKNLRLIRIVSNMKPTSKIEEKVALEAAQNRAIFKARNQFICLTNMAKN